MNKLYIYLNICSMNIMAPHLKVIEKLVKKRKRKKKILIQKKHQHNCKLKLIMLH